MFRTANAVRLLQAVAVVAGLAVLLWSLGLPSLNFANAASLTNVSDTLTDSAPNVVSNHDIAFTLPSDGTPLASADTITITFPASTFDLSSVGTTSLDFATTTDTGDYTIEDGGPAGADNVGVATTSNTIVFTLGSNVTIATGTPIFVEIGTNATFGGTGTGQIVNPATSSYEISISTNEGDAGATRVVILENVQVTASVDTVFDFTVAGVSSGGTVNGQTISGDTSATAIPFGTLASGTASTTAHDLNVSTNASQGYVVTVRADHTLLSSTGADIDFINETDTPVAWSSPTPTLGDENTYGYWGITSEDGTTTRSSEFTLGADNWTGISTTTDGTVIMSHTGPADGSTQGIGSARIGYRAEITDLQEAGDDYESVLTYIATPTF